MNKFFLLLVFGFWLFAILKIDSYQLPITLAQSLGCLTQTTNPRAGGLISAEEQPATSKFGNSGGQCAIDPKAVFVPYKIPTYDDLKSIYFDQARPTASGTFDKTGLPAGDKLDNDISLGGTKDHLYYVNGTLRVKNNISGSKSAVVFVKNDLRISASQLTTGSNGIVFVVGGNAYIWGGPTPPPTTRVDAVIIAQGQICTAYKDNLDSGCPPDNFITSQLEINGSLISLNQNPGNNIKFRRLLSDNTLPAEKIVHQPKYLVILKDLFSDTLQKWSEIQ